MVFKNFEELIQKVQKSGSKKIAAVVAAHDEHTLQAVFKARKNNIAEPLLIGNKAKIKEILNSLNESLADTAIIEAENLSLIHI